MINLTYCCQRTTVIEDFRDLRTAGQRHILACENGAISWKELREKDAVEQARELIRTGDGIVTPYGVLYYNSMTLEPLYTGNAFPECCDGLFGLIVTIRPEKQTDPTILHLPCPPGRIERALKRGQIKDLKAARVEIEIGYISKAVCTALDMERETLEDLNEMCAAVMSLSQTGSKTLDAEIARTHPASTAQITALANKLAQPDLAGGECSGREQTAIPRSDGGPDHAWEMNI